MKLDLLARKIIKSAYIRDRHIGPLSRFYGIDFGTVRDYLRGRPCGTLPARKVIRVEIARKNAEKKGDENFFPRDSDRYKGTR